jgi:hypothetical protein
VKSFLAPPQADIPLVDRNSASRNHARPQQNPFVTPLYYHILLVYTESPWSLGGLSQSAVEDANTDRPLHYHIPLQPTLTPVPVRNYDRVRVFVHSLVKHITHICEKSSHLNWIARQKQPAGTADWWEYAPHQGIRGFRDALGTLGVP